MRIVAFAYACEPDRGSEPGGGWMWSRILAGLGETWVVTRANNRETIERALASTPERANLHFVYVDLPAWARFWKRGNRGARLYYMFWQIAAVRAARRLDAQHSFDVAWHLTMANAWLGSLAAWVGPAFVYGPVGGGVSPPFRLLPSLGLRGILYEAVRAAARTFGRYANPLARLSWRRAQLVLVQNPETRRWLPAAVRSKAIVFPHVVVDGTGLTPRVPRFEKQALYAGRLLPWKGVSLGLRAIARTPDWTLVICGSGPDERRLRRLAVRLGISDRVEFRGWQSRAALAAAMRRATLLLFPSLHDEGGWVVTEALVVGLPVLCLDHGGPPVLGGEGVEPRSVVRTAAELARRFDRDGRARPSTRRIQTLPIARARLAAAFARAQFRG